MDSHSFDGVPFLFFDSCDERSFQVYIASTCCQKATVDDGKFDKSGMAVERLWRCWPVEYKKNICASVFATVRVSAICLHVSSVFDPLAGELSIKKILKEYIVSGRTIALIFLGQFIFAKNYFIHMIFYARMKTGASKDIYIYGNQSIDRCLYIYIFDFSMKNQIYIYICFQLKKF